MSILIVTEPATNAAPIRETVPATARAFLRPSQSVDHPWTIDPRARPRENKAFTAPSILLIVSQLSLQSLDM